MVSMLVVAMHQEKARVPPVAARVLICESPLVWFCMMNGFMDGSWMGHGGSMVLA